MNKLTKIGLYVIGWNSPLISLSAYAYGSVNNGVTTITEIKDLHSIFSFGDEYLIDGECPNSYFPEYIKINDTKYDWVIDSLYADGYVKTAHVNISSPIVINNIYFSNTSGVKGSEENLTYKYKTFYDFNSNRRSNTSYSVYNYFPEVGSSYNMCSIQKSNSYIDGEHAFSSYYTSKSTTKSGVTTYNGLLYQNETYRFMWKLGDRSYTQDVKATSEYSISSGDFMIPKEWCDQLIYRDGGEYTIGTDGHGHYNPYLFVSFSMVIDGKTIYEWSGDSSYKSETYMKVDADPSILPTIDSVTLADTRAIVPSSWSEYVQSLSNVAVSAISASGNYGSPIVGVTLKVNKSDYEVTGWGTLTSPPKTSAVMQYGEFTVTVTVTDMRNRTQSKTSKITFLPYSAPTIDSILSQRCKKDGTIDNDGTYAKVQGNAKYYSCNGKNSYHVYVAYKRTDQSEYGAETEVTLPQTIGTPADSSKPEIGNFDTEYSYDMRYRISDTFNTVYYVDYLSTAVMMMHFMRGGRGVAFGQKATVEYCVDTSFNALFRGNVGFEINKKFYTIEQIINALKISGVDSLSWVENNKKEF